MKFTISRDALITPLQLVSGAVEKRHTLPILANVLMVVENDKLSLTGTDLEVELVAEVALEGEVEPGEITVPARKFLDICKSLKEGEQIKVKLEDNHLRLVTSQSRFSLSTLPATEYPGIEESVTTVSIELAQNSLKQLIEQTQFAMAQQDVRYYLNGMLMQLEDGTLTSVATDGHRLALSRGDVKAEENTELSAIVPRKGVIELSRLLESGDDPIELKFSNNHLRARTGRYCFTSKLVDGRFPDYDKVLPMGGDKEVVADREPLKEALARAAILCNEKFRGVRLMLGENTLRILANNPEQEEAEVEVYVEYNGPDLEVGFNVSYLLDVLNTVKSEQVKLICTDANSSALIEEVDGGRNLYVVMPMRL